MVTKLLLLACLAPMVLGGNMMEMWKMMEKMQQQGGGEGMGGGEMGGEGMGGMEGMGDMGGDMEGMGEMGGDMEGMGGMEEMGGGEMGGSQEEMMKMMMQQHYEGDGDCQSKEEAMKKKYMLWKKWSYMMKMKEKMEKKQKMKEEMEKMKKFKMFMEAAHKKKEEEAMEQKKKMWMMWEKYQQMKQKKEKEEEFKELIEGFQEQKHKYAFSLTHHFLLLCKCGEMTYQMNQMFMGDEMMANMNNGTDMMDGMDEAGLMEAWERGNMMEVAQKMKAMPKESQKKLYMAGLIKSMCTGAKTYINYANKFRLQYMMDEPEMTTPSGTMG